MKTYRLQQGSQKEVKVNNKDLAQDLSNARGSVVNIWMDNIPTTEEEQAIWIRLRIAIQLMGEAAEQLKKQ